MRNYQKIAEEYNKKRFKYPDSCRADELREFAKWLSNKWLSKQEEEKEECQYNFTGQYCKKHKHGFGTPIPKDESLVGCHKCHKPAKAPFSYWENDMVIAGDYCEEHLKEIKKLNPPKPKDESLENLVELCLIQMDWILGMSQSEFRDEVACKINELIKNQNLIIKKLK